MPKQETLYQFRSENIVTRQMGDEVVLVPLSNKVADMTNVITLNEVGGDILKAIETPSSVQEVVNKLVEIYDVDRETLLNDVEEFIREAVDKRVVEVVEG